MGRCFNNRHPDYLYRLFGGYSDAYGKVEEEKLITPDLEDHMRRIATEELQKCLAQIQRIILAGRDGES